MPRVLTILGVARLQAERGRRPAYERRVIASAVGLRPRHLKPDAVRHLGRQLRDPACQIPAGFEKPLRFENLYPPGAIVLVEGDLQTVDDVLMVLREGTRSERALLLAAPVASENRAARTGVCLLEDAHRLEHGDRARPVVGGAGGAVPAVEVRREEHILVRKLAAAQL